jgi:hypothetical protein
MRRGGRAARSRLVSGSAGAHRMRSRSTDPGAGDLSRAPPCVAAEAKHVPQGKELLARRQADLKPAAILQHAGTMADA